MKLSMRSNIDSEIIPHWKVIREKFGTSVTEFFDMLVERGMEYMTEHMMGYRLTGKLHDSVRRGIGGQTGLIGRRGYFYDLSIVIGAPHAEFVDEGTKRSPGGYFRWIDPVKQHSVRGGRISKDHKRRSDYKPHPGTPARNFRRDTITHLEVNLSQYFDSTFRWLFGG